MIVVSCSVIIINNRKVLLVKEDKQVANGRWNLPGGKLEEAETLRECAIREVYEETGLTINGIALSAIVNKPKSRENNTVVKFVFKAQTASPGMPENAELKCRYFSLPEIEELAKQDQLRGKELARVIGDALDTKELPNHILVY